MSTVWRMKRASSGVWVNLWVNDFSPVEQMESKEFSLHGRTYTGVGAGRLGGMRADMKVLVLNSAEDDAVMTTLKSREPIDLESALDQSWSVRAVGNISREQVVSADPTGPQPVKHQFFISFTVVEVEAAAAAEEPTYIIASPGTYIVT